MDKFEELRKYKELLDDGVISQEDFDTKKRELLSISTDAVQKDTSEKETPKNTSENDRQGKSALDIIMSDFKEFSDELKAKKQENNMEVASENQSANVQRETFSNEKFKEENEPTSDVVELASTDVKENNEEKISKKSIVDHPILLGIASALIMVFLIVAIFSGGNNDSESSDSSNDSSYTTSESYSINAEDAVPLALAAYLNAVNNASSSIDLDVGATRYSTTVIKEQTKGTYNYYAEGTYSEYDQGSTSPKPTKDFTMDIDTEGRKAYVKGYYGGLDVSF